MSTIYTRATKGSALTWTEGDANITNLNNDKLEDIVEDTTPQLGGNLDVNGNSIVSASNADITIAPNGTGIVSVVSDLEVGYGTGTAAITSAGAYDLDLVTNSGTNSGLIRIVDGANGNIELTPNGTGSIVLDGLNWPQADGTADYVLKTNGTGQLSWTAQSGGGGDVVSDTTPQLGGNLDVQANIITTSVTDGNITITPDGNGSVILSTHSVQVGESTTQGRITTSGGNLRLDTNSGTNSGYIAIYSGANGTIELEPNGTGDVWLRSDTVVVGDDNATATITSSGTGNLVLNTNFGTNTGNITITQGVNANIEIAPNGTGDVLLTADTVRFGDANAAATITTNGTGNLVLNTNAGTNSGNITVTQGANANITLTPNGTGQTVITNLEYQEFVHALGTTSGTIAPNAVNGNVQTITLNGNLTINAFTSPVSGQSITLIINTNGNGRTLTSSMLFAGGVKTISAVTATDILTISYIGTTYYASIVKDFK